MVDPKGGAPSASGSCDGDHELQLVRENLIETAPGSNIWQQTLYLRIYDDTGGGETVNGLLTIIGANIIGIDHNPRIPNSATELTAGFIDLPNAVWAVGTVSNYDDNGQGADGLEYSAGNPNSLWTNSVDSLRHNGPAGTRTAPPDGTFQVTQIGFSIQSFAPTDDFRILLQYDDLDPGPGVNFGDAWFNLTLYAGPNTPNPLEDNPDTAPVETMGDGTNQGIRLGEWNAGGIVDDGDYISIGLETVPDLACAGDPGSLGEGNGGSTTDSTQTLTGIRLQVEDLDIDDNGGSLVGNIMTLTTSQLGVVNGTFVLWNGGLGANDVDGDNGSDEGGPDMDIVNPVTNIPVTVDLDNIVYTISGFAGLPPGSVSLSNTVNTLLVDSNATPTVELAPVGCGVAPGVYTGTVEIFEDNDADNTFDDPAGLFPTATGETRDTFDVTINITADPACPPGADLLPGSGFTPDRITQPSAQPPEKVYANLAEITLEIPELDLQIPIVGVPLVGVTWDVQWLGGDAGYLEGTAFPTWAGNTALTGHVVDTNGLAGPFAELHTLSFGDQFFIHAWGKKYVYEVRYNYLVFPHNLDVLRHEEYDWVTLLTCHGYDESTDSYRWRRVVSAVLVDIDPEG